MLGKVFRFAPTSWITAAYVVVLLALALIGGGGYYVMNALQKEQVSSARVINLSGRQRMLSQRIVMLSQQIVHTSSDTVRENARAALRVAIQTMADWHQRLSGGSLAFGIDAPESAAFQAIYFDPVSGLDQRVAAFLEQARRMAGADHADVDGATLDELVKTATALLASLDNAVTQYQNETEASFANLERLSFLFIIGFMGVLVFSGVFVFRPVVLRLTRHVVEQQEHSAQLESMNALLGASQQRFRSAIESVGDGLYIHDNAGTIHDVNQAACDQSGYTHQELLALNMVQLDANQYGAAQQGANDRGSWWGCETDPGAYPMTVERDHRRKDGSVFPMEARISLLPAGDDGHFFVVTVRDISVRKKIDARLRKNEERFRAFADTASDWLWETDEDHRFVWFSEETNARILRALGKRRWEVGERTGDGNGWADHIRCHDERRPFHNFEYSVKLPDGVETWLSVNGTPYFDEDGTFRGYRGAARDITSRREKDRLLLLANNRFRDFVETASDWVWETNQDHRFTYVSERFFELVDTPEEKVLGSSRWDYMEPDISGMSEVALDAHRAMMDAHQPFSDFHYKVRGRNNNILSISISGRPFFDEKGDFVGYRGTGSDRTALDAAMNSLKEAKNQAEAANMAKSQFLSSMSHELRTPLNAIIGFSQLMDDPANPLNDDQREALDHIIGGGAHLLDLVNEILDLAGIESGKVNLTIEPIACQSITDPCLTMAKTLGGKHDVTVMDRGSDAHVPPQVMGDLTRAKQVLLNLLSNAIKYNRKNGFVFLDVSPTPHGMIRFSVTDTGPGISDAHLADLFMPFNRLANKGSEIEGTGIGLTITKELVEQMNGRIGVRSTVGEGSCFWFELPAAATDDLAARGCVANGASAKKP